MKKQKKIVASVLCGGERSPFDDPNVSGMPVMDLKIESIAKRIQTLMIC